MADRVAVVTGSTRGIGLSVARKLGTAGYRLILNYRSHAPSARAAARALKALDPLIVKADVSRPEGARKLIRAAVKSWGRVDLLVNNVGDFFETPVSKMDLAAWDELWDSNVRTALNCTREVLPGMRKRGSGSIITIGGTATQMLRGNPTYVAYAMAKT